MKSILCLILIFLTSCTSATPTPQPASNISTDTTNIAYNFTLQTLNGEVLTLQALRGRWVIVNFWATWCEPCKAEMPYLQQLATEHVEHLTVLGINMRETPAEIEPFLDEFGITFPILLDPHDEMLLWYSPRGLPLTYLIAPDGTVAYRQFGPLEPEVFEEELRW